jgi:hypothetical protein
MSSPDRGALSAKEDGVETRTGSRGQRLLELRQPILRNSRDGICSASIALSGRLRRKGCFPNETTIFGPRRAEVNMGGPRLRWRELCSRPQGFHQNAELPDEQRHYCFSVSLELSDISPVSSREQNT